jgi:hypothetical protein
MTTKYAILILAFMTVTTAKFSTSNGKNTYANERSGKANTSTVSLVQYNLAAGGLRSI